ncbi:Transcriptional regulator, AraC family [Labilithrix luteola]|uniref:Transcriptional regulator, AraC family n=1 Tax=Labilithrix luteola TaxID=1391654 RepID=A0A0K1PXU1_9BACT|nr:AraC family transcriptional regulator [Labilithrix luteola]AKU97964.1 Transcriptional regulator, AraC family [Labilithrix luteola]
MVSSQDSRRSSIRYIRTPELKGTELHYLRTWSGAAAPGVNPHFELILVDSASKTILHRGASQTISSGFVGIRSPYETGKLARRHANETRVRIISFSHALVSSALEIAKVRKHDVPSVLRYGKDRVLRKRAEAIFTAVEAHAHPTELEMHVDACAMALVGSLVGSPEPTFHLDERSAASRVRDILHDRMNETFTLNDLAREVALTRHYVVHAFKRAFGIAPYEYLMHLRVAHARVLLASGMRPVDVAHAVGFYDQSHLNRWFHKAVGMTPGQYAADISPQTTPPR